MSIKNCPICGHQQTQTLNDCELCGWNYPVILGNSDEVKKELETRLIEAKDRWDVKQHTIESESNGVVPYLVAINRFLERSLIDLKKILLDITSYYSLFLKKLNFVSNKVLYFCKRINLKYLCIISGLFCFVLFYLLHIPETRFHFYPGSVDKILINGKHIPIEDNGKYQLQDDLNEVVVEKVGFLPFNAIVKQGIGEISVSLENIFDKSRALFFNKQYDDALHFFEMIKDNPKAYFYLGYLYNHVENNYELSNKFYFKGCEEENDTSSCNNLGVAYENGWGFEKNASKAFEYYLKASNGGDSYGHCAVANAYFNGIGTTQNYSKSVLYLAKEFPNTDYCNEVKDKIQKFKNTTYYVDGISFSLKFIPEGQFSMGCLSDDVSCNGNEKPIHEVTLSGFKMMETEVTFSLWDKCVKAGVCNKTKDEEFGRGSHPVIAVSFDEITNSFIPWLNKRIGLFGNTTLSLPSEAQWEYAARAGTSTKYSWGNTVNCANAQYNGGYGSYCSTISNDKFVGTASVASFKPNYFGLFDMHGNVSEWTNDCKNDSYKDAPENGRAWLVGDCSRHVIRGGSWLFSEESLRSAYRTSVTNDFQHIDLGFRLIQNLY